MKNISFSVPGSVILAGEYAMLFGKPAIACAINFYATASYSQITQTSKDKEIQFIEEKIKEYLRKRDLLKEESLYTFQFDSNIPIGTVFGFDDAKTVVAAALMLKMYSKRTFSKEEISTVSYQIEKIINKKELGIHCTASTFGGLVYYRKEFEFLKNISSLNLKIPKTIEQNLFFIDLGEQNKSIEALENFVGKSYNMHTKKIESIFNNIERTTKRIVVAIAKEDGDFFNESIIEHERLLEDLGVVSKSIQRVVRDIEQFGGAKIIGNRFLLSYSENKEQLTKLIDKYQLSHFPFCQSVKGLEEKII